MALPIPVKIKQLHPEAQVPTYGTEGSACFDLYAVEDAFVDDISHPNTEVRTGLAFEFPEDWQMLVFPRSGNARKHHVTLTNAVAVIDSDYRGELVILLSAHTEGNLAIKPGDRIAQAQLIPVHKVEFTVVDELGVTKRGAGGFGHTGR